jgi:hypothetical protein
MTIESCSQCAALQQVPDPTRFEHESSTPGAVRETDLQSILPKYIVVCVI